MAPEITQKIALIPSVEIGNETFLVTKSNGLVNARYVIAIESIEEEVIIRCNPVNHFAYVVLSDAEEAPEAHFEVPIDGGHVAVEPAPAPEPVPVAPAEANPAS